MPKKNFLVTFQLSCILREVRYLNLTGTYELPEEVTDFFKRVEELWKFVQNLNQMIIFYNHIRQKSRPVEYSLFEDEVILVDLLIDCGIRFLDWNSPGKIQNPTPEFFLQKDKIFHLKKFFFRI